MSSYVTVSAYAALLVFGGRPGDTYGRRRLIFLGFSSWMFVMSLVLQQGLRLGPPAAGITLVPMGVAQFDGSLLAPRVVARVGTRTLAVSAALHITGLAAFPRRRWARSSSP